MTRADQRRSFLVSAVVHLMLMTALMTEVDLRRATPKGLAVAPKPRSDRVFLPPPALLRQLAPTPPPQKKDRTSVGARSIVRRTDPIELRPDEDLTRVAKGRPDVIPRSGNEGTETEPAPTPAVVADGDTEGSGRARTVSLPPGGTEAANGKRTPAPLSPPSIGRSLRNLDKIIADAGIVGLDTGQGRQMGPMWFDPKGADFTNWDNHAKDEVFRNWIVPQVAMIRGGDVLIECRILRDGSVTQLRIVQTSGNRALDRAAANALLGSRLLRLPEDYGPDWLDVRVQFSYGMPSQGS